ncbi:MAG: hypothetical protein AAF337_00075 [Pseudomonadota bacterium]
MSTTVHPDVMDSALTLLSANAQTMVALSALPTQFSDTASDVRLASSSVGPSDFTLEAALTGRKLSVGAKVTTIDKSGTAAAIALLDDTNQRVLFAAPIPAVPVVSGDVVHFLAWSITFAATA